MLILMLSLVFSLFDWGASLAAGPATLTRVALENSYVDPRFPSAVFGGSPYLNYSVNNMPATNQTYIFTKFDVSNLPSALQIINITVTLGLLTADNAFATYNLKADSRVGAFNASNAWSENTLTFNNSPSIAPSPVDIQAVATPGTYIWNVTSLIKPMITKTTRATIVFHHSGTLPPPTGPFPLLLFQSKDAASTLAARPALTITYRKNPVSIHLSINGSINGSILPSKTTFGSPVIIQATVKVIVNGTPQPAPPTGTVAIQFSTDSITWSDIVNVPPGTNGTVIALWFPPVATPPLYYIRASWSGDLFIQSAVSAVQQLTVAKGSTATAIILSASTIGFGNQTLVIASITPQLSEGVMVVEYSTNFGANWAQLFFGAPVNGISFQPFIPSVTGTYLFRARWLGDANYNASSSSNTQLTVSKAPTTLTLSVSQASIPIGSTAIISGFLRAAGGSAVSNARLTIQIEPAPGTTSGATTFTTLTNVTTDIDGSYVFPWMPQTNGTYLLRSNFDGTNTFTLSTSRTQTVSVGLQLFPTTSEIGLISGFSGFFIGLAVSFLVRFRRQVTVKRRQRYGGTKTKGEQTQR